MNQTQCITNHVAGEAGKIHFQVQGVGNPTLVFVHSLAGNAAHWDAQLSYFSDRHRVVALDLRGHGDSVAGPEAKLGIEALADDLDVVLDELGMQPQSVILVGHSMGGLVALECAARRPELIPRLFLVDSAGDARGFPAEQKAAVLASLEHEENLESTVQYWKLMTEPSRPELQEKILNGLLGLPRRTLLNIFHGFFEYDPTPALRKYSGKIGALVTPFGDIPGALHKLRTDIATEIIQGTGHWLHLDKPDEFNRALERFIN